MWRGCHTSVDSGDLNQTPPKQSAVCSTGIILSPVAKVLWTCVIISPEEIPELQRPRRATGNRRNLQCEDDSILRANVTRDTLSGCGGGLGLGVGLAGCRFLCAALLRSFIIHQHEWSGPQHPAHGGVTFPGILFMTWQAQGVMNGWLLVFLSRMCCHKAS